MNKETGIYQQWSVREETLSGRDMGGMDKVEITTLLTIKGDSLQTIMSQVRVLYMVVITLLLENQKDTVRFLKHSLLVNIQIIHQMEQEEIHI